MNSFLEKLDSLDASPIQGEYKLWILDISILNVYLEGHNDLRNLLLIKSWI